MMQLYGQKIKVAEHDEKSTGSGRRSSVFNFSYPGEWSLKVEPGDKNVIFLIQK